MNSCGSPNKFSTLEKYRKLILKLNRITEQRKKLNFECKLIREKIDEFEANNIKYIDELNKIKLNEIVL
jgi:hypothetical protein